MMLNQPPSPKATHPPERARAAAFVELSDVWEALDVLAPKRAPTRAEWLATLAARSPREPKQDGAR
jgi:hypothetical protein